MKEKIYKKTIIMFIMGILILMITTSAHALPCIEDWCFDTIPDSGDIAGPAGSTIGWGYTITNPDPVNWLSFVAFGADPFLYGTPDASVFDFPTVAPGDTVSVAYDGFNGLFQLTWDNDAPDGFVNTGNFLLNAEWLDPIGNSIGFSFKLAPFSATVTSASVPEPSTFILVISGLSGLILCINKVNHKRKSRI